MKHLICSLTLPENFKFTTCCNVHSLLWEWFQNVLTSSTKLIINSRKFQTSQEGPEHKMNKQKTSYQTDNFNLQYKSISDLVHTKNVGYFLLLKSTVVCKVYILGRTVGSKGLLPNLLIQFKPVYGLFGHINMYSTFDFRPRWAKPGQKKCTSAKDKLKTYCPNTYIT